MTTILDDPLLRPSAAVSARRRRLPIGAEVVGDGVHFRVWAPDWAELEVVLAEGIETLEAHPLEREPNGYFSGWIEGVQAGALYWLRRGGDPALLADPASRFQPEGPLGPSQVVDPGAFRWSDQHWPGLTIENQVISEVHVGGFTPEGDWAGAAARLADLADAGITVVEIMPVSDFAGRFGWGYDGVDSFAPTRLYGSPDEFRAFVDKAHALGLGVILDVVYNHLGPVGNVLPSFAKRYFTDRYHTDWGEPYNFDGPDATPVREYVLSNARYWIEEFHLDGFRLDATQNIYDFDDGHEHILAAIVRVARQAAAPRRIVVVAENEPQDVRLIRSPDRGGFGMDAMWNDDFHHTAMVALTGRSEAYYTDYHGSAQELVSAAKHGFLYQGQRYKWQSNRRGTSTRGFPPACFINFLQNHDQIANSGIGERIHKLCGPSHNRAMTAYVLLIPGTPMLFMGQEFGASQPFFYFADSEGELAEAVDAGRRSFLSQFRSLGTPEMQEMVPRPDDPATFERCKLDWSEREANAQILDLHRDLLRLRREDPVLSRRGRDGFDGAVIGLRAFVLRFFAEDGDDRLIIVNLDVELHLDPAPEPLLAPPADCGWCCLWSSEDPRYGGAGTPPVYGEENWRIPGRATILLRPEAIAAPCGDAKA